MRIISGTAGAGKTKILVNIANSLATSGKTVLILNKGGLNDLRNANQADNIHHNVLAHPGTIMDIEQKISDDVPIDTVLIDDTVNSMYTSGILKSSEESLNNNLKALKALENKYDIEIVCTLMLQTPSNVNNLNIMIDEY